MGSLCPHRQSRPLYLHGLQHNGPLPRRCMRSKNRVYRLGQTRLVSGLYLRNPREVLPGGRHRGAHAGGHVLGRQAYEAVQEHLQGVCLRRGQQAGRDPVHLAALHPGQFPDESMGICPGCGAAVRRHAGEYRAPPLRRLPGTGILFRQPHRPAAAELGGRGVLHIPEGNA